MKKMSKLLLAVIIVGSLLTACAEAPTAKVTEAKALIESVIAAGGVEFAPEKVASIQKSYDEAVAEIAAQNDTMFKNYALANYTLDQLMDDCDRLKIKISESKGEPLVAFVPRLKPASE